MKSGLLPGQSNTSALWSVSHLVIFLALWMGPSCMKTVQPRHSYEGWGWSSKNWMKPIRIHCFIFGEEIQTSLAFKTTESSSYHDRFRMHHNANCVGQVESADWWWPPYSSRMILNAFECGFIWPHSLLPVFRCPVHIFLSKIHSHFLHMLH